ncbi:MAG: PorV/PorQ family protein [Elusimicrobiaceae bacterium]
MKKYFALNLLALFLVLPCRAEKYSVTSPDFFLNSASGARALALGTAQTAAAEGPSALYWNPALLGQVRRDEAAAGYSSLFEGAGIMDAGISHSFAAPFGAALSVAHYSMDGAQERDAQNNVTGSFGDKRTALLAGTGYQYSKNLYFGLAGRFINQSMAGESESAFALDAGVMFSFDRYRIGAAVQNALAGSLARSGGSDPLPLTARLGAAANVTDWLMVCADAVNQNPGNANIVGGVELTPLPALALRGGYNGDFVTFGAGVTVGGLSFDYAALKQEIFGFSHRVSLRFMFGPSLEEKRAARL